jgi:hypothetical protein
MNPEFRRNLWLELTPRRVLLMTIVLVLTFFCGGSLRGCGLSPRLVRRNILLFHRRDLGFAQCGPECRRRNPRPHLGRPASVVAERVRHDLGQTVRFDDLQLVRRRDLPRRHRRIAIRA